MTTYLVELYRSRVSAEELAFLVARAHSEAEALTRAGRRVRFLRSFFLDRDETLFSLYEAATPEDAAEVAARAGLGCDRVVEATHLEPREVFQ